MQLLHNLFKIAVNAAGVDEILSRNRFTKITLSSNDTGTDQTGNHFTPGELNSFLSLAKKHENETNYTFLLMLAYTGMRHGEALSLQWKDVNFKQGAIIIERTRDNKGVRTPKTKKQFSHLPCRSVADYSITSISQMVH